MNKTIMSAVLAALATLVFVPAQAGDAAAGKAKAAACAGCHGADGNSANPVWPKLAGQNPSYIAKQLKDFKTQGRKDATMAGMAAGLSEQDRANIGAYYATLKVKVGAANPEQAKLGETLYRAGDAAKGISACMACHGPAGKGNDAARFPAVAGQHAAYTAAQLKAFRDGKRTNDGGRMMQTIAKRMSDAEIAAVAQYMQGLH